MNGADVLSSSGLDGRQLKLDRRRMREREAASAAAETPSLAWRNYVDEREMWRKRPGLVPVSESIGPVSLTSTRHRSATWGKSRLPASTKGASQLSALDDTHLQVDAGYSINEMHWTTRTIGA